MSDYLIKGKTLESAANSIRECLGVERYSLKPEVVEDVTAKTLVSGSVTVYYTEIFGDSQSEYQGFPSETDAFVVFDYLENNEGVTVPVLYKADIEVTDPDDECYGPDWIDQYFYVGTATIEDVVYNKWRKLESSNTEMTWDGDFKVFVYTNVVVDENTINPTDIPDKVNAVYEAGYAKGYDAGMDSALESGITYNSETQTLSITIAAM